MTIDINTKNDLYCFGQDVVDKLGDRAPSDKYIELNIRVRGQLIETTKTSACYGCKSSLKLVLYISLTLVRLFSTRYFNKR